jgi:hypothetical protein
MNNNNTFNSFSTSTPSGSKDFMASNTLVSKFAFLLLVIFGFIVFLNIGISVVSYFLKPSESPKLINGMVDATQMIIFPQDPSDNAAVTIYRSNNATDGIEFSWSVWLYITNFN